VPTSDAGGAPSAAGCALAAGTPGPASRTSEATVANTDLVIMC